MGDKGDKSAARRPEGSLVETRCLIKGPKSAIVPFAEPRSGPKSRTGSGVPRKKRGGSQAEAGGLLASNLPLVSIPHPARMLDGPAKAREVYF